jgi:hypothetical protein
MDEIQKELVKAGRKDLAQKYYKKISGTIGEDDHKAAEQIRPAMESVFKDIEDIIYKRVKKSLSTFNQPGFTVAFLSALQSGIMRNNSGFDSNAAKQSLEKNYFKRV